MDTRTIIACCRDCGCPFFADSNRLQHSLQCPAADSKFIFGGLVRAKGVKNLLFARMVIVSVLKNETGAHVYNAQAVKCHSLVISGGENDFEFWQEPISENS